MKFADFSLTISYSVVTLKLDFINPDKIQIYNKKKSISGLKLPKCHYYMYYILLPTTKRFDGAVERTSDNEDHLHVFQLDVNSLERFKGCTYFEMNCAIVYHYLSCSTK